MRDLIKKIILYSIASIIVIIGIIILSYLIHTGFFVDKTFAGLFGFFAALGGVVVFIIYNFSYFSKKYNNLRSIKLKSIIKKNQVKLFSLFIVILLATSIVTAYYAITLMHKNYKSKGKLFKMHNFKNIMQSVGIMILIQISIISITILYQLVLREVRNKIENNANAKAKGKAAKEKAPTPAPAAAPPAPAPAPPAPPAPAPAPPAPVAEGKQSNK